MRVAANELSALVGTYRLLGRLWLREVDEPVLAELNRPPLYEAFTAAGASLPQDADPQTLEALAVDFCQLFLGPSRHLPPYQSVWQRGQFQGEAAESMQRYAAAIGYDADGMMFDHFGLQLDMMGQLLDFASDSALTDDEVFPVATAYFAAHLAWSAPLLEAACERAQTDFYRSLIILTGDFLDAEAVFWSADHS